MYVRITLSSIVHINECMCVQYVCMYICMYVHSMYVYLCISMCVCSSIHCLHLISVQMFQTLFYLKYTTCYICMC